MQYSSTRCCWVQQNNSTIYLPIDEYYELSHTICWLLNDRQWGSPYLWWTFSGRRKISIEVTAHSKINRRKINGNKRFRNWLIEVMNLIELICESGPNYFLPCIALEINEVEYREREIWNWFWNSLGSWNKVSFVLFRVKNLILDHQKLVEVCCEVECGVKCILFLF